MTRAKQLIALCISVLFGVFSVFVPHKVSAKGKRYCLNVMLKNMPMKIGKTNATVRHLIVSHIHHSASIKVRQSKSVRRVVFICDLIKSGPHYSHDKLLLSMANAAANQSECLSVLIVATHESSIYRSTKYNKHKGPSTFNNVSRKLADQYQTKPPKIDLKYCYANSLSSMIDIVEFISSESPDVLIFNSGLDNESRLIRSVFYNKLPIVQTMTQSNMMPDAEVDLLLSKINSNLFLDLCLRNRVTSKFLIYPTFDLLGDESTQVAEPIAKRKSHLITAVTGKRIKSALGSLSPVDLSKLLSILNINEELTWILIGEESVSDLIDISKEFEDLYKAEKVKLFKPVADLRHFFSESTLYINIPGITGGGDTGMLARNLKLPVLTDEHSDVANKQPRSFIAEHQNMDDFVSKARLLITDDGAREVYFDEFSEMKKQFPYHQRVFFKSLQEARSAFNLK